jgi:hypothetical protein
MLSFAYERFDGRVPEPGELDAADRELLAKVEAGFETVGALYNDTIHYHCFSTSGPDTASHARPLRDSRPLERLDELALGTFSRVEAHVLTYACGYVIMSLTLNVAVPMPFIAAPLTSAAVTEAAGSPW